MSKDHVVLLVLIAILGLGIIAYKEDTRCNKDSTPSCHYTLREKLGPL